jgi:TIR domain
MKVFLSHSAKDGALAAKLAQRLRRRRFTVWAADEKITPGDNWATETGKALDDSDMMLFLLTPSALQSDRLRQDIEFALGTRRYENRVFSVFVGPTFQAGKDVPWILFKLPFRQIESESDFDEVVDEVWDMCSHSSLSGSNA